METSLSFGNTHILETYNEKSLIGIARKVYDDGLKYTIIQLKGELKSFRKFENFTKFWNKLWVPPKFESNHKALFVLRSFDKRYNKCKCKKRLLKISIWSKNMHKFYVMKPMQRNNIILPRKNDYYSSYLWIMTFGSLLIR